MSTPIFDMVAIVRGYLLTQPNLTEMVGERVSDKTPEAIDVDQGWVRLNQLDARNETGTRKVEHLVSYYLQIDSYAGGENRSTEAFDISKAVRAALVDLPKASIEGVVVTDVGFLSMPSDPDPDVGRERVILDCEIWAHPA